MPLFGANLDRPPRTRAEAMNPNFGRSSVIPRTRAQWQTPSQMSRPPQELMRLFGSSQIGAQASPRDTGSIGAITGRFRSGVEGLLDQLRSQFQEPAPEPENPLGALYDSLLQQLQAPVSVDEADLMNQIRAQFDPVFDARREALQQMMAEAQQRSQTGRQEVVNQYESLGQNYEELAPQQLEQAEEQQAATEELFSQLRSNVEGNYSRIQQEQADLFSQLGIEEALPQVLEPQGEDAQRAMARADELGTLAQQRQADVGNIEADYYRSGAPDRKSVV